MKVFCWWGLYIVCFFGYCRHFQLPRCPFGGPWSPMHPWMHHHMRLVWDIVQHLHMNHLRTLLYTKIAAMTHRAWYTAITLIFPQRTGHSTHHMLYLMGICLHVAVRVKLIPYHHTGKDIGGLKQARLYSSPFSNRDKWSHVKLWGKLFKQLSGPYRCPLVSIWILLNTIAVLGHKPLGTFYFRT